MVSKWAKLKDTLPKFQGNDTTYQERVNQIKTKINDVARIPPVERPMIASNALDNILTGFDNEAYRAIEYLRFHTGGRQFASAYAAGYRDARKLKEALEAHAKAIGVFLEAYTQLYDDQSDVEGISSVKLDDGCSLRSQPEPFATVEDRETFRKWCIENGYEQEMTLPWQTTNAIVKDRLETTGEDVPGVKVWWKPKVVFTKAKARANGAPSLDDAED